MAKIKWDQSGERVYETGIKNGVLYLQNADGTYGYDPNAAETVTDKAPGVAWNGLTSVTETPSGAEANAIYADDFKYLNLYSLEEFGITVEAYTFPDDFMKCDGTAPIADGIGAYLGQQERKSFGLCYKTTVGNDVDGTGYGYKLHLIYGCKASPSERAYSTINDSPEAITFSWEVTTTAIEPNITGMKPTSIITIDSTRFTGEDAKANLAALEAKLFGVDASTNPVVAEVKPYLPLPAEVLSTLNPST